MKKLKYTLLIVIISLVAYGIKDEMTFTALREKDFKALFPNYSGDINRSFYKDFIGWSRGDLFKLFIYKMNDVSIDSGYPKIGEKWEYMTLRNTTKVTKWLKCPLDSVTKSEYCRELTRVSENTKSKGDLFKQDLENPDNYYCSIYVNPIEKYFLLYNSSQSRLYYIRQKGF